GMRDVHSPGGTIDDGVVPFACATDGNGFQRMVPRWAGRTGVGEVGQQKMVTALSIAAAMTADLLWRILFTFSLFATSFCLRDPSPKNHAAFKPFGIRASERKRTPSRS